jgi:predicted transcriptional regulator of viral defense system
MKRADFINNLIKRPRRDHPDWEPYIATELIQPSYISLEKALEMHNLIPEAVFTFTCVTTKRPAHYETPMGVFDYRYIRRDLFWGYEPYTQQNQTAFVALPEKALLDYFYFLNGPVTREVVEGLRLQSLETIEEKRLLSFAEKFRKPKIARAAREILDYRKELLAGDRAV